MDAVGGMDAAGMMADAPSQPTSAPCGTVDGTPLAVGSPLTKSTIRVSLPAEPLKVKGTPAETCTKAAPLRLNSLKPAVVLLRKISVSLAAVPSTTG